MTNSTPLVTVIEDKLAPGGQINFEELKNDLTRHKYDFEGGGFGKIETKLECDQMNKYGKLINFTTIDKFSDLKYSIKDALCFIGKKSSEIANKERLLNE